MDALTATRRTYFIRQDWRTCSLNVYDLRGVHRSYPLLTSELLSDQQHTLVIPLIPLARCRCSDVKQFRKLSHLL